MNLYLFNDNDSAYTYGIGTYLKELTESLESTTIHVHIVHLHSVRSEFEIVKTKKIEHWYIPEVKNNNTLSGSVQKVNGYLLNVSYLLWLNIKDTKNLVFHFNYNTSQPLAKELKMKFNCKTVATVHYLKWELDFQGNLNKFHTLKLKSENKKTKLEKSIYTMYKYESLLFKEVDYVIVLSQNMKNFLCSEYQIDLKKMTIISNGLSDITSISKNDNAVLRKKWHLSEKESLLLFAGRLDPVKGLLFLIRAFRKVLEVIPECRLIIAGSGLYDTYFQEAEDIWTKITFTGLLEKQKLFEFYQIADIGVVPSLYEPFGYVAVEMMMHELPIIATATSGLNEVVDDSCGLKIPIIESDDKVEIDTDLLSEKIIYLLEHPIEAKQLGKNAREKYLKYYSSEVFRRNMMDFYQSLYE